MSRARGSRKAAGRGSSRSPERGPSRVAAPADADAAVDKEEVEEWPPVARRLFPEAWSEEAADGVAGLASRRRVGMV